MNETRYLTAQAVREALSALICNRGGDLDERDFYVTVHPDRMADAIMSLPSEAWAVVGEDGVVRDQQGRELRPLPGFA